MMDRPRHSNDIKPEDIPLDIVFEDDDLMVINKPAGMVVHPGCGNYSGTLVNAIAWHLRDNPDYDPNEAYISREDRPEWDKVCMFGKLYALDDGSCVAGGYAMVGINGALTYSSEPTNMYVMKRTAEDVIYILLK